MRFGSMLGVVLGVAACRPPSPAPSEQSPQRPAPPAEPSPPPLEPPAPNPALQDGDDEDSLDEDDMLEEAEVDIQFEAFEHDLDGDGAAESIACTCDGTSLKVRIGSRKHRHPAQVSEPVGCGCAVVELAEGPARHLYGWAGEHEEVGPSHHAIFSYDGRKIRRIWSGPEPTFYVDRSWSTEDAACDQAGTEFVTTTVVYRLAGRRVEETVERQSTPVEEDDCLEPDDP